MTGSGRRFDLAELSNGAEALTEAEIVAATAIARDLEAIAERDDAPTVAFSDKVMATIAAEPTPKPTRVFGAALRTRRFGTAVAAVGDAWRVAFGGGRPFTVRGQALALVLVVLIGVLGLGGGAAVGAARLLNPDVAPSPTPAPSVPASVAFAGAEPRADTITVGFADAQSVAHGDRRAERYGRTDRNRRFGRQLRSGRWIRFRFGRFRIGRLGLRQQLGVERKLGVGVGKTVRRQRTRRLRVGHERRIGLRRLGVGWAGDRGDRPAGAHARRRQPRGDGLGRAYRADGGGSRGRSSAHRQGRRRPGRRGARPRTCPGPRRPCRAAARPGAPDAR